VRVLAAWEGGIQPGNWGFAIAGTPCEPVYEGHAVLVREGLHRDYPTERHGDFQSFIGIPLRGADQEIIGHLAIYAKAPIETQGLADQLAEIASIIACRAETETARIIRDEIQERAYAELAWLNRQLERESVTDPLTRLYNKQHLDQRLQESFARMKREKDKYAIVALNVDGLDQLTATYGPECTDGLLQSMADLLRRQSRQPIDVLARTGANEFGLICHGNLVSDTALVVAERIRAAVAALPCAWVGATFQITASVGVSLYDPDDTTAENVYTRAAEAHRAAMRDGGNRAYLA
jgi:diguanylate cyclase (GGDEF)-like protein